MSEGPVVERTYRIDSFPAEALAALLGRGFVSTLDMPLPPLWHHLYGHDPLDADAIGPDGHPRRGNFLPDLPGRRMWAAGELAIEGGLHIGDTVHRRSTIRDVVAKQKGSTALVFVEVEHCHRGPAGRVDEIQHVVYVDGPKPQPTTAGFVPEWSWYEKWRPDPCLLFRYSALTWNGHRIHYDADYARETEGYPGLVVHGPLLATLLLELAHRREARRVRRFSFHAKAPLFVDASPTCVGRPDAQGAELAAHGDDGRLAMTARVSFKDAD